MGSQAQDAGALSGIRVLDLTRVLSGPYCTMMLADQGADVVKIEIPERGDDARHVGPPFRSGESAFFISINRNKKSLTLNLKSEAGVNLLKRLVACSDVLVENYRPGVTERLGIDYDSLSQENPRLIYCSISGFGQTGPYWETFPRASSLPMQSRRRCSNGKRRRMGSTSTSVCWTVWSP